MPVERDGTGDLRVSSCEYDTEEMDVDTIADSVSDIDADMGGAVAGLLSMRGSGSSEWTIL